MMKKKQGKRIFSDLRDILVEFLEAAVHHILASRSIYPSSIFKKRLFGPVQFGVPIMVSDHPDVNDFITDGLTGVRDILMNDIPSSLITQFDLVIIQNTNDGRELDLETYIFQFEFPDLLSDINILLQPKDASDLEQNIRGALLCLTSRLSEIGSLKPEVEKLKPDYCFNFRLHTSYKGSEAIADDFRWCKSPAYEQLRATETSCDEMDTEEKNMFSICDMVEEKSKKLAKPNISSQTENLDRARCEKIQHKSLLVEPTAEDLELLSSDKIKNTKVLLPVYSFSTPFKLKIMIEHTED